MGQPGEPYSFQNNTPKSYNGLHGVKKHQGKRFNGNGRRSTKIGAGRRKPEETGAKNGGGRRTPEDVDKNGRRPAKTGGGRR